MSWYLGGVLAGGVAYSVLRECTIPVLLARRTHDRGAFAREVLVASDGTEGSERLVEVAGSLAASHEGNAVMVHALGGESQARPRTIEAQAQPLQQIVGGNDVVQIEPGDAHTMILEPAKAEDVSLIVIGTRRRAGLSALGSVSRRVIHKAPCWVLGVPPEYVGD